MKQNLKFRKIFAKIWENIDNNLIILLNGARQTGKTSLMDMTEKKLLDRGVSPKQILRFDLEKSEHLAYWERQINALNILPLKDIKKKYYLFIDEFQRAKEIGSTLKVIHDHYPHIKIIITGSASWYLNIDESMAGRKIVIKVWPLDFEEFIHWQDAEEIKQHLQLTIKNFPASPPIIIQAVNNFFLRFLSHGGYPGVALIDDPVSKKERLNEIINSYLIRDIKIWNYAANSLQVKKLLILLASQVGSLLESQNLSQNTELGRTALQNRLELLQNTFILYLIRPYCTNKIKELVKNPKVFLADSGLRNALLDNFSVIQQTKEFGHLAENFVFSEILKNHSENETFFWRTRRGQETDLILRRDNNLIPVEVKAGNAESIPSGLRSFIRQYKPRKAYLLNWSIVKDEKYYNCSIYFRPLWFAGRI